MKYFSLSFSHNPADRQPEKKLTLVFPEKMCLDEQYLYAELEWSAAVISCIDVVLVYFVLVRIYD